MGWEPDVGKAGRANCLPPGFLGPIFSSLTGLCPCLPGLSQDGRPEVGFSTNIRERKMELRLLTVTLLLSLVGHRGHVEQVQCSLPPVFGRVQDGVSLMLLSPERSPEPQKDIFPK